jgi:hypothetical protein
MVKAMYRKHEHHGWFWRIFNKHKTHLRLSILNSYYCVEHSIYSIEGSLDMIGLKGTLNVTITPPTGDVTKMVVDTADDGAFAVQFVADLEGTYSILVEYMGASPYVATSAKIDVKIVPVPIPTMITLVGPDVDVLVGQTVNVLGTLGF